MKLRQKVKKIKTRKREPWRLILPIVAILAVGSLGAYLTFSSQGATEPTFKLFAPAWRGLGGPDNKPNLPNFKRIFTSGADPNITRAAAGAGSKVYSYMLGPYTVAPYVPESIMNPDNVNKDKAGGAKVLDASAYLIGASSKRYVPYANGFKNNFLLNPESSAARNYARERVGEEIRVSTPGNQYDGVLSDSMGVAPIQSGYLNEKPMYPGTSTLWTDASRWITAQQGFLAVKKDELNKYGKALVMNGLANGDNYYREPLGVSSRALLGSTSSPSVDGAMAERIFREPHTRSDGGYDAPANWLKDVRMIADVQSRGIDGYWWTKCWSVSAVVDSGGSTDSCRREGGGSEARITKIRRYTVASFLMGAGSKSYYNFDADKYEGTGKGNAAEWYGSDYNKAMALGTHTSAFSKAGNVYKRDFSNGLAVVNPEGSAQTINLGSTKYTNFEGATVTGNYTLGANTGDVLLKSGSGSGGDTVAPNISRTAPAAGATISATLTAKGTASDNVAVTKVELLIDGAVKGTDLNAGDGVSISMDSKTLSNASHTLALKAYDAAGNAKQTADITIAVANGTPPPDPTITAFTANPNPVTAGGKSWLSWTTTGTTTCSINPDGVKNTSVFTWQTPALTTVGTKNYTLDCINSASKHVTKKLALTVKAPATAPTKPVLTASKTSISPGQSSTLSWTSTGATSCTLNPGSLTTTGPTGSRVVSPTSTTSYTVTCKNSAGSTASDAVKITVSSAPEPPAAPVIVSFTADPARIEEGQQSTLSWSTSNVRAGGCRLAPSPLSSTDPNGSWSTPTLTTSMSYTLTCVNSANVATSKSVSVNVADKPTPDAPDPDDPDIDDGSWDDETLYDEDGEGIDNGSYDEDLSGLAVLDPTNITDEEKIANIEHVEYYLGEELLQYDDTEPFALDTTLLKNGTYTITEKTYYLDGSTSEITRTVDIQNDASVGGERSEGLSGVKLGVGIGMSLLLIAGLAGGYLYLRKRHLMPAVESGKLLALLPWRRKHNDQADDTSYTPESLASSLGAGTVFSPTDATDETLVTPPTAYTDSLYSDAQAVASTTAEPDQTTPNTTSQFETAQPDASPTVGLADASGGGNDADIVDASGNLITPAAATPDNPAETIVPTEHVAVTPEDEPPAPEAVAPEQPTNPDSSTNQTAPPPIEIEPPKPEDEPRSPNWG